MINPPKITTKRAAEIYDECLWLRRELFKDGEFFKVADAWDAITEENPESWTTKTYRSSKSDIADKRAGIVIFENKATLVTDEQLIVMSRKGCRFSNFILAHEITHAVLDHHAGSAKVKNFQVFKNENGVKTIVPPTIEELEAHLGAAFFQCGIALEDKKITAVELANRAYSDFGYVKKAQNYAQLDVFQEELQKLRYERLKRRYVM